MTAPTDSSMPHAGTASLGPRTGHGVTILAWAFTVYMLQGYLLVPFDQFEAAIQDVCEAARVEAEEAGSTHEGWTVVVDERCNDIQLEPGAEADASETVERP
jgi:hypothetical protein